MYFERSVPDTPGHQKTHIERYVCPFCLVNPELPGQLTIRIDRLASTIIFTECSKGYVNCCSIAELLARFVLVEQVS